MSILLQSLLELALFFIFLVYTFQIFQAFDYEKFFKKGHTRQIQLAYIFSVIIISYLLTKAIMNIIMLSTHII